MTTAFTIAGCRVELIQLGWAVETSQRGESIQICCTRNGGGYVCAGRDVLTIWKNALAEARKQVK